jgi:cytochrome c oxidase subunit II
VIVLWVCLGIFVVVFGAMFYALFKHRRSLGHAAHPFHESTTVEVIWTLVPIAHPGRPGLAGDAAVLAQKDSRNPDLTVKVTGYQWKWEYDYLQDGVRYMSNMSTPRAQIDNSRQGRALPAGSGSNPWWCRWARRCACC